MKENEWISVEDRLPKPNTSVEVKHYSGKEEIAYFKILESILNGDSYGFTCNGKTISPEKWRTIPEKRPDFSKLKKGDLVHITNYFNEKKIQSSRYFHSFRHDYIVFVSYFDDIDLTYDIYDEDKENNFSVFRFNTIEKITRINIEEQTFEEI